MKIIKLSNDIFDSMLLIRKLEDKYNIELTVSKESLIYIQNINNIKTTIKEIKEIKRNINYEKVPVVTIYRYYFFGLLRREIKLAYKVKNGKVIFEEKPRTTDTVIITYKYEED